MPVYVSAASGANGLLGPAVIRAMLGDADGVAADGLAPAAEHAATSREPARSSPAVARRRDWRRLSRGSVPMVPLAEMRCQSSPPYLGRRIFGLRS
jgi:hypothetical protein